MDCTKFPHCPVISAVGKEDWVTVMNHYNPETGVFIRRGFRFDGASIPRWGWRLAGHPMMGDVLAAALEHDSMYASHLIDKDDADSAFLENMKRSGVGFFKRRLFYLAVRLFGGASWKRNVRQIETARRYVMIEKGDDSNG